jgi:hypothetical protein
MGRNGHGRTTFWVALLLAAACGENGVEADPAVAPFVGTWDAEAFTITSDADPSTVVDLLAFGGFYIVIEPSGQYTATLQLAAGAGAEIGQLTVIGSTVRLDPSHPPTAPTATSNYAFTSSDYLVLDGPTVYDFNFDLVVEEPGQAHIELRRR